MSERHSWFEQNRKCLKANSERYGIRGMVVDQRQKDTGTAILPQCNDDNERHEWDRRCAIQQHTPACKQSWGAVPALHKSASPNPSNRFPECLFLAPNRSSSH